MEISAKRLRELANILESEKHSSCPSTTTTTKTCSNHQQHHLFSRNKESGASLSCSSKQQQCLPCKENLLAPSSVCEMAPLDENCLPKYKGKKRGRNPKKRLGRKNPHAKERALAAYTLVSSAAVPVQQRILYCNAVVR
jgi:hypothetical protein